jgi:hypothetical protein
MLPSPAPADHTAVARAERAGPGAPLDRQAELPVESPAELRSTWERIPLAPDVELHVRRPLSRSHNRLVDRLIDHARHLFSEEP